MLTKFVKIITAASVQNTTIDDLLKAARLLNLFEITAAISISKGRAKKRTKVSCLKKTYGLIKP